MKRFGFIAVAALNIVFITGFAHANIYNLVIDKQAVNITGRERPAVTINGAVPGPLLRWREGEEVTVNVTNRLDQATSIHWHGILLPADMDGVPGVSFDGIRPGTTFTYRFTVKQSGTYWYHSHSGAQEQSGFYAPIIIDPVKEDIHPADREYVIFLSDWTDEDPHHIMAKLKKQSGYYNFQQRTIFDFFHDIGAAKTSKAFWEVLKERMAWGRMRMDPTDISDVTGHIYTFLVNGKSSDQNWTAIIKKGDRVRLRFINGAAMTYFDVKIPGLKLEVVQADGQNVQPVRVDEFRIAVAETYDVIVRPKEDRAYTIFAEAIDRSGYARATLAPREGMTAPIPRRQERSILTMDDMPGMNMKETEQDLMGKGSPQGNKPGEMAETEMGSMAGMNPHEMAGMGHGGSSTDDSNGPKTLSYRDLRGVEPLSFGYDDKNIPKRSITLRLTGNMVRYIWTINDNKFSDADPINVHYGERFRITFVNETMMNHPMHLHGMWMQLENGHQIACFSKPLVCCAMVIRS